MVVEHHANTQGNFNFHFHFQEHPPSNDIRVGNMLKTIAVCKIIERKHHTWCEIQANLVFHVLHLLLQMKKRN